MAAVLLTHANHVLSDPKQRRKMQPYPPLQTLFAAASLRRRGFEVAFVDVAFEDPLPAFRRALDEMRPAWVAVVEDNFNFLTKMCLTANRERIFAMAEAACEAGVPLIVNGSDATDRPDSYLEQGATAVALGEPERTLEETAEALAAGRSLDEVAGLALPGGRRTAGRVRIGDLDALPDPAWDLVDLEPYHRAWREAHGRFSVNVVSSRGCPYRCNWCAKPIFGATYQARSPEAVAREVGALKARGAEHVWFADDIFALSAKWTRAFADAVERLGARLPFKMQSRCGLMTRAVVADLERAGCEEVWMGAESGAQSVLEAMDKDMRVGEIGAARANLARHGIRAGYFLQFGYPGETWEDIAATVEMVRATRPDDVGVSVSYPLPGTPFYDRVAAELGPKTNWTHSDDLAMMFQGAYTTDFYRRLRDAVHLEVEVLNGRAGPGDRERLAAAWDDVSELEKTSARAAVTVG